MRLKPVGFKTRILLWYTGVMGVILIGFASILFLVLSHSLNREVDRRLKAIADVVAQSSLSPRSARYSLDFDAILERFFGFQPYGKFVQVVDRTGQVGFKSTNLRTHELPVTHKAFQNALVGRATYESFKDFQGRPFRVLTYPVTKAGRVAHVVQVGSSLEEVRMVIHKLSIVFFTSIPGLLLLAGIGGWWLTDRFLSPINQLTATADSLTADDLDRRIDYRGPDDEIGHLVSTFNRMMGRLKESFTQLKRFSADVSHELRTPLTIMKGEVELILRRPRKGEEYRQTFQSLLEEVNRLSGVVDDILTLAKVDMGLQALEKREGDLGELVDDVITAVSPLADAKGITLHRCSRNTAKIEGDFPRLSRLLTNLIDNAIKYTPEGGDVFVDYSLRQGMVVITVRDTGPGIPDEYRDQVFERFFQIPGERKAAGAGLGLSIAWWIAKAHGGWIEIVNSSEGGAKLNVWLPMEAKSGVNSKGGVLK